MLELLTGLIILAIIGLILDEWDRFQNNKKRCDEIYEPYGYGNKYRKVRR